MHDTNRMNRIHVKTVRFKGDKYYVVLEDARGVEQYTVEWSVWNDMPESERRSQ